MPTGALVTSIVFSLPLLIRCITSLWVSSFSFSLYMEILLILQESMLDVDNLINKMTKLSYSWVCPTYGVVYKGIPGIENLRVLLEFCLTQQPKCSYSNPFPIMILLLPALCRWRVHSWLSGQIWFPLGMFWLPPWLILSLIIFSLTFFNFIQTFLQGTHISFSSSFRVYSLCRIYLNFPLTKTNLWSFQLLIWNFYLAPCLDCKLSMDQNYHAKSKTWV